MTVTLLGDIYFFVGLSTDKKEIQKEVFPGSIFIETDTGQIAIFDGKNWIKPVYV